MINATQNPHVKKARKYHQKKYRHKDKRCLIEGFHLLEEARRKDCLETVFLLEPHPEYPTANLISETVMKHLTDSKNPPPAAAVAIIPETQTTGKQVLILEHIQDPGNVGTLIRSALAFGFDTIISDESADFFSPKVLRSTQGAVFHLQLHHMTVATFKQKNPAHTLIGTALSGEASAPRKIPTPYALILGNEGAGLKTETLNHLDHTVMIPMRTIDSLNVGVAGSILMYVLTAPAYK